MPKIGRHRRKSSNNSDLEDVATDKKSSIIMRDTKKPFNVNQLLSTVVQKTQRSRKNSTGSTIESKKQASKAQLDRITNKLSVTKVKSPQVTT